MHGSGLVNAAPTPLLFLDSVTQLKIKDKKKHYIIVTYYIFDTRLFCKNKRDTNYAENDHNEVQTKSIEPNPKRAHP